MADELTLSAAMTLDDGTIDETLAIDKVLADMATKKYIKHRQLIGITEEALVLGEVTSPGWAIFVNRDETNYIELKVATSGAIFAKLLPGEFAILRLGSGAQVPYAIAHTDVCYLEYFLALT